MIAHVRIFCRFKDIAQLCVPAEAGTHLRWVQHEPAGDGLPPSRENSLHFSKR